MRNLESRSDSSSMRIHKFLEGEDIGNRTTSQCLRHFKTIAGSNLNEDFLRNLWLNRLPVSTQHVLAPMAEKSSMAIAEMTDWIHEIRPKKCRKAQVSKRHEIKVLRKELQCCARKSALSVENGKDEVHNEEKVNRAVEMHLKIANRVWMIWAGTIENSVIRRNEMNRN